MKIFQLCVSVSLALTLASDGQTLAESQDERAAGLRRPKTIAEPEGSIGYRVNVVSPLEKIFQGDDYAPTVKADKIDVAAARNEYESAQVVIEAPWRPVTIKESRIHRSGRPRRCIHPRLGHQVGAGRLHRDDGQPPYFTERGLGSYPDPLMPAGEFTVDKLSRVPVWITLKTPKECPCRRLHGDSHHRARPPEAHDNPPEPEGLGLRPDGPDAPEDADVAGRGRHPCVLRQPVDAPGRQEAGRRGAGIRGLPSGAPPWSWRRGGRPRAQGQGRL